ncbi:MAG: hypothetical protein EB127_26755, partial [Alphaproteobacteria bacterium]|nr:hypothetical protein [Alphaproteobacteria bacterium]
MSSESDKQTKTTSTRREKAIAALFSDEPSKKPDKKNKKGTEKKTDKPTEDEVESADMSITVAKKADTLQYQKLQLRDQILLRPDTYIGSVKTNLTPDPVYYLDDKTKMFKKGFLQLNDGLLRLFIEAISNAIDNVWRSVEFGIPVKFIKVTITKDKIGIWNDGRNITCATHPTEGIPIPEMIFGHLLTSSNYNDNEERKTSGKNGLGIK